MFDPTHNYDGTYEWEDSGRDTRLATVLLTAGAIAVAVGLGALIWKLTHKPKTKQKAQNV